MIRLLYRPNAIAHLAVVTLDFNNRSFRGHFQVLFKMAATVPKAASVSARFVFDDAFTAHLKACFTPITYLCIKF